MNDPCEARNARIGFQEYRSEMADRERDLRLGWRVLSIVAAIVILGGMAAIDALGHHWLRQLGG